MRTKFHYFLLCWDCHQYTLQKTGPFHEGKKWFFATEYRYKLVFFYSSDKKCLPCCCDIIFLWSNRWVGSLCKLLDVLSRTQTCCSLDQAVQSLVIKEKVASSQFYSSSVTTGVESSKIVLSSNFILFNYLFTCHDHYIYILGRCLRILVCPSESNLHRW